LSKPDRRFTHGPLWKLRSFIRNSRGLLKKERIVIKEIAGDEQKGGGNLAPVAKTVRRKLLHQNSNDVDICKGELV